jgi:hypothetical protein
MKQRNRLVIVNEMTNREFLETYAAAGRVGLIGATHFIDVGIKRAQRPLRADRTDSQWTHAFLFEGTRVDGHHWVIESDLDIANRNVRFGVQENRIRKYFDEAAYPIVAVLDFGLEPEQIDTVVRAGLDMLAEQWEYSIRELFGTLIALPSRRLRSRPNLLQKERSFYCSAFVQHLFLKIGLDFAPDTDEKHTAPEQIVQTSLPHTAYILKRD